MCQVWWHEKCTDNLGFWALNVIYASNSPKQTLRNLIATYAQYYTPGYDGDTKDILVVLENGDISEDEDDKCDESNIDYYPNVQDLNRLDDDCPDTEEIDEDPPKEEYVSAEDSSVVSTPWP
ncbi:unnamed protein product [Parnassius apollo]|uniref:(apollo) hypothetical protein n=1 Tax=Parnassius apollo TaxID=110799 RepID=A0A8S3X507_PARAO|nr:unnamed protein product [Parnassius apollo]